MKNTATKTFFLFLSLALAGNASAQCVSGDCANGYGTYVHENSGEYEGNFQNYQRHGKGTYLWNTGDRYVGEWANGTHEGYGTYIWGSGDLAGQKYAGNWSNGIRTEGKLSLVTGDVYTGSLSPDGNKHGIGRFVWASGGEYYGEWNNGQMHGQGKFIWATGEEYEGNWKNGIKEGYGVLNWPTGSVYEGSWKGGKRDGLGKITWRNSTTGSNLIADNDTYWGEWVQDDMKGYGILYDAYGNPKYIGLWTSSIKAPTAMSVARVYAAINEKYGTDYTLDEEENQEEIETELVDHHENKDETPPVIVITSPSASRGFDVVSAEMQTTQKLIKVTGKVTDNIGVFEVTVNGADVPLTQGGAFSKDVPLVYGKNTIKVTAKDNSMNKAETAIAINRQYEAEGANNNQNQKIDYFEDEKKTGAVAKKIALIVGNSNYTNGGSLKNPANDANAVAKQLTALGFDVFKHLDLSQNDMKRAIDEFGDKLDGYDVALFFYAGHGVQVKGNNYLVPTSANIKTENDVEYECVRADRVLAKMESSKTKTNILILDACRNNPFERSWSRSAGGGSGLATMNAPVGSFVSYATAPGTTASDGEGANGTFTAAFLKQIAVPGLSIEQVFKKVRSEVIEKSGGAQTPWEASSLVGDFFFKIK